MNHSLHRFWCAVLVVVGIIASYPNLRGSAPTDSWSPSFFVRGPGETLGKILHSATLPSGLVELMGTSEMPDGSQVSSLAGTIQAPDFGQAVPSDLSVNLQSVPYEVPFGTTLPDGTVLGDLLLCGGGPFASDGSLYFAGGSRFVFPPNQQAVPILYVVGLGYPFSLAPGTNTWSRLSDSPYVGTGAPIPSPGGASPGWNGRWYSTAVHRGDNAMMVIAGSELVQYEWTTGDTHLLPNLSIEMDSNGVKTLVSSHDSTPPEVFNGYGYTHAWQLPVANAQTLMIGAAGKPVLMTDSGAFTISQSRRQGAGTQSEDGAGAVLLPIRVTPGEWGYSNGSVASIGGEAGTDPEHRIDVYDPSADTWKSYEMWVRRGYPSALTLPDLRTLIVGGAGSDNNPYVGWAESWDPRIGSIAASDSGFPEVCGYHTTTTLLLDGSVFMTCGQPGRVSKLGGERGTGRIFYPDYMTKPRPSIMVAPETAAFGATTGVLWSGVSPIAEVDILSLPSMTHSFVDQRAVQLKILQTTPISGDVSYSAFQLPTEPNVAPAGYYMLVVIDTNRVPSIAKIIKVG